jgi:hypothetical protein
MGDGRIEFVAEVRRDGNLVGSGPVTAVACLEDARFRGVVAGRFPNDGRMPEFAVTPTLTESNPPRVAGLALSEGGAPAGHYDFRVFAPQARAVIQRLVREGRVETGAALEWSVVVREPNSAPPRFGVRREHSPYPLRPQSLSHIEPGTLGVEIAARVLEELRAEVVTAGAVERAALLVGHLLHDEKRGAALVRVTGKIDVEEGPGGSSKLHFAFGTDSFRSARKRAERLNDGTAATGWIHSHPPCELCADRPECRTDTVCFSSDDEQVHATAFGGRYMLGLVAGKLGHLPATRPGFRLYGWEKGCVTERRFEVVEELGGIGS